MKYAPLQDKLKAQLDKFNAAMDSEWRGLVDVVNEYNEAISNGNAHFDAGFPPEIERLIDHGANCTAWIYTRLEEHAKPKRKTGVKIRKAMGYNG